MAENQGDCQHGGHGPICGPDHHSLHRSQHPFHGYGALPHDSRIWYSSISGKPGKYCVMCFATTSDWWKPEIKYSHFKVSLMRQIQVLNRMLPPLSSGVHRHLHSRDVLQDHRPGSLLLLPGGLERIRRHHRQSQSDWAWFGQCRRPVCTQVI